MFDAEYVAVMVAKPIIRTTGYNNEEIKEIFAYVILMQLLLKHRF